MIGVSGWKIRAKNRFTGERSIMRAVIGLVTTFVGPFTANTSHPILFMGTTGGQLFVSFVAH